MKVLITTDWYKPVINGVVTSVVSLAEGLAALGAEVRILTLSGDRHSYTDGNVTYLGSVGVEKIYPNARFRTAPSSKYIHDLVEWHPDVVHSQCEFSTFIAAKKIAKLCHCPLVHTCHTDYENVTHYFSPSVRLGKGVAAILSKHILSKVDVVIAPTRKVRDKLQGYGVKKPVAVIPSGLEFKQFESLPCTRARRAMRASLGIGPSDKVLLFLGRLAQEKNIEELLDYMGQEADSHLQLLLVGDGPYRRQLEEKAKALHLEERVIFAGMVGPDEVATYYALGDVFVSASCSETQGLTYIEAIAAGLPLLCRDDPCLESVIQNDINGLTYVDRRDFSLKLQKLLGDGSTLRTLGKAAKETAYRRFSVKGFAESVLNEYQKLLPSA